jgi:hypothetical protein
MTFLCFKRETVGGRATALEAPGSAPFRRFLSEAVSLETVLLLSFNPGSISGHGTPTVLVARPKGGHTIAILGLQ